MKDAIVAKTLDLGFDRVGFARAKPLPGGELAGWLSRGCHGEMAYMAKEPEVRVDPSRLVDGARTVIVVAKDYWPGAGAPAGPGEAVIARYARGRDHHKTVGAKLKELEAFVRKAGGRARSFLDSGPILEKRWAERAGLGWQGKHSIIVMEGLSSWVFLSEVVTDLDLPPDEPGRDRCGSCTRCIEACPTGAIVAPRVVDARRCIAYHTIECDGFIPAELRPLMGNRVFGCDACQEACPRSRKAGAREEFQAPRLADLLVAVRTDFDARFRDSAIRRSGRAGLARSVCVAIGNSGDRSAVPALAQALEDDEPVVRGHAAWALGRLGARRELEKRLAAETSGRVREEIAAALAGA